MFSNILKRPVLGIVRLGFNHFPGLPVHCAASYFTVSPKLRQPSSIVFIAFPGASADVLTKSTLVPLEAVYQRGAGHALYDL